MRFPYHAFVFTAAVALAGCANVKPPETPPGLSTPPPITEGGYSTYQTTRVFNAPLVPLRQWIEEGNRIVAAMEETDRIKKPVNLVVLSGTWPETGSVRRLEFSDGHFVLERVLQNDFPNTFRYQVWDYTSAAGSSLSYALGEQSWRVLPDGRAELTWTYSLRARSPLFAPFVRGFVENDMKPLMDRALDRVVVEAQAQFAQPAAATPTDSGA